MSNLCKNVFEAILKYGHDEDFDPVVDAKFLPTDAPAGSQEKIEVLQMNPVADPNRVFSFHSRPACPAFFVLLSICS